MRLTQMAIDTTATNRKLQMGGTQFIASEPVAAVALKCDPPEAAANREREGGEA